MIAVQHKVSGQLIDLCETRDQAQCWLSYKEVELVDTDNASKIEVIYTELGGPWGYGNQEPSFTTYGGLLPCVRRLCMWMQSSARTFGPDWRDIKDFFRNCRLYVNGEDKSNWLFSQIELIHKDMIFA
jgi:hypothetical protein